MRFRLFRRHRAAVSVVCADWVELVTEYLEGSLDGPRADAAEAHLADCDLCVEYLAQMRLTVGELGRVPAERLSARARGELLEAFRDWSASQST